MARMFECVDMEWANVILFDLWWPKSDLKPEAVSGKLLSSLVGGRAILLEKLSRAEMALEEQLPFDPAPFRVYYLSPESSSTRSGSAPEITQPSPLFPESEQPQYFCCVVQPLQIRVEHLREMVRVLRERCRQLSVAIRLLLDMLVSPVFPYQLVRRERAWCLIHGSHPPRPNAGLRGPAVAEFGRVSHARAC
jgi:hypothetical protein